MPIVEFKTPRKPRGNLKYMILTIHYENMNPIIAFKPQSLRNRVIGIDHHLFIHVSFGNLESEAEDLSRRKNCIQQIKNILQKGVMVGDQLYLFCGHSNSQLRSRSCFLFAAEQHQTVVKMINQFGDFYKIKDVVKRSKRIGLLFSNADQVIYLEDYKYREIKDIERDNHNFTDGCGLISESFSKEIARKYVKKRGNMGFGNDYVPSVLQIRYKGYKGTLVVEKDEKLKEMAQPTFWQFMLAWFLYMFLFIDTSWFHEPKVIFRKSLKKFENCRSEELLIVEHSKPGTAAKLNSELVMILSSLGVGDKIFCQRLKEYFDFIGNAARDIDSAISFLEYKGRYKLIKKLYAYPDLESIPPWMHKEIWNSQVEELKASFDKHEMERVHIMIPKSRLLFGVCDTSGQLKEGECFVRFTTNGKTLSSATLRGRIIVGRNPCLHPGDIRVLKAVDHIPELDHLVDCIVFSTDGALPPASLMSGGDLDGDKFFVSWDRQLFPPKQAQPFDYSLLQRNQPVTTFKHKNEQIDLIDYFARYNNHTLGRITSLYQQWIRARSLKRAFCKECIRLNELYSKCVDGEDVEILLDLSRPPKNDTSRPFILDILTNEIKRTLSNRFTSFLSMFEQEVVEVNGLPRDSE